MTVTNIILILIYLLACPRSIDWLLKSFQLKKKERIWYTSFCFLVSLIDTILLRVSYADEADVPYTPLTAIPNLMKIFASFSKLSNPLVRNSPSDTFSKWRLWLIMASTFSSMSLSGLENSRYKMTKECMS